MLAEARSKGEQPSDFLKWTEIRYGHIPDFKDAKIPSWTETPMSPELVDEWLRIVLPREFQLQALVTLKAMWEGAPKMLSENVSEKVIPWEPVFRFLEASGLSLSKVGIREIKDDLAQAAQDLAKKCGCEIKQIFLTSGEYDVLQIIETANADNIAKYALANGSLGFVRSHTALAWPLEEATKILSDLP
jgi:uncharacterized protein with GYD domain